MATGWGTLTDAETSRRMRRVRRRDTPPELAVRQALYRLGYRFRTSNSDLPGSPDIANRRHRWAIFVHGCFWHVHRGCRRATLPESNRSLWLKKFDANVARDLRSRDQLAELGYFTAVIWECEARNAETLLGRLHKVGFSTPPTVGPSVP